jgi:hypothetical protein
MVVQLLQVFKPYILVFVKKSVQIDGWMDVKPVLRIA